MESTNNPEQGTGLTVNDAATHIETLLDSETGTTEQVDADNETEEVSNVEVDEATEVEEQSEQDSESVESDTAETQDETTEPEATDLSDETLVDVQGEKRTLKEVREGYMRQSDYTRKTQELKQHLKTYQLQQKDLNQVRAENLQAVELMALQISQAVELADAPTDQLLQDDPHEYLLKRQKFERQQSVIHHLRNEHAGLLAEKAKKDAEQLALRQVEARSQLNEWHPEFADGKTGDGLLIEVGKFMINDLGYSPDEVNMIDDPRHFRAMYRLFQAEQRAKHVAKVVPHFDKKPPLTAPGNSTKTQKQPSNAFSDDVRKYKRSGDFNDAVSVISKLL
jgi:hypothetical protein